MGKEEKPCDEFNFFGIVIITVVRRYAQNGRSKRAIFQTDKEERFYYQ
ncbi:hypothetical protein [Streptococcus sp. sy018]|nr:hypothetical protein [Streptococcus sp. sy018]